MGRKGLEFEIHRGVEEAFSYLLENSLGVAAYPQHYHQRTGEIPSSFKPEEPGHPDPGAPLKKFRLISKYSPVLPKLGEVPPRLLTDLYLTTEVDRLHRGELDLVVSVRGTISWKLSEGPGGLELKVNPLFWSFGGGPSGLSSHFSVRWEESGRVSYANFASIHTYRIQNHLPLRDLEELPELLREVRETSKELGFLSEVFTYHLTGIRKTAYAVWVYQKWPYLESFKGAPRDYPLVLGMLFSLLG